MKTEKTNVVLVDDHKLLRNGLAGLIMSIKNYTVLFEADNGKDFLQKLSVENLPEIVLMDINMPEMDGYDTTAWLKKNYPTVKVLALSMYDNEESIIRIIKCGARGYILKDMEPSEFKVALDTLCKRGYYYSEMVADKLMHAVNLMDDNHERSRTLTSLNDREMEFIKLACTQMTYKEIADKMFLSARTIDGYRDDLFQKLGLKNRVGLVLYAIKNGIVNL
jgi:DNA-binding NarL/FixJ family response regulator